MKVFVGNLSFQVEKDELQKTFEEVGKGLFSCFPRKFFRFLKIFFSLLVLSANIITRGNRSRGYGFVEMATIQDAQKAVEALNHKEIHARQINVEIGISNFSFFL